MMPGSERRNEHPPMTSRGTRVRSVLKLLMAAVALVGCLAAPRPVPAAGSNPSLDSASRTTPYTRLYVFGDSYSDIGGGYVDGNGPTAVAYLGWLMGLQIASSQAPHAPERSLVFAVSGAGTGDAEGRRVKEALLGYGMLNQVRDFASRVKSGDIRFDPQSTLFFIAGGLNDGRLQTEQTVANLRRLDRNHPRPRRPARHRRATADEDPAVRRRRPPSQPALQQFADREGRSLGVDLWMNHWGQGFDDVMEHPAAYGIANTTDACAGRALFDQDPTPVGDPPRSSSTTRVIPRRPCTGSSAGSCSRRSRRTRRA
jgi:hypothetical protein